jgi:hypothetical protein
MACTRDSQAQVDIERVAAIEQEKHYVCMASPDSGVHAPVHQWDAIGERVLQDIEVATCCGAAPTAFFVHGQSRLVRIDQALEFAMPDCSVAHEAAPLTLVNG